MRAVSAHARQAKHLLLWQMRDGARASRDREHADPSRAAAAADAERKASGARTAEIREHAARREQAGAAPPRMHGEPECRDI